MIIVDINHGSSSINQLLEIQEKLATTSIQISTSIVVLGYSSTSQLFTPTNNLGEAPKRLRSSPFLFLRKPVKASSVEELLYTSFANTSHSHHHFFPSSHPDGNNKNIHHHLHNNNNNNGLCDPNIKTLSTFLPPDLVEDQFKKISILIAEDNEMNVVVITKMLDRLGYTNYCVAENGKKVLEAVSSSEYDIILMDVMVCTSSNQYLFPPPYPIPLLQFHILVISSRERTLLIFLFYYHNYLDARNGRTWGNSDHPYRRDSNPNR